MRKRSGGGSTAYAERSRVLKGERRYIYSGDTRTATQGALVRSNRRGVRRRVSAFNAISAIFAVGIAIVFYIGNILAVNQLASDIDRLESRYDSLMTATVALKAEIDKKSSVERIGAVAAESLGMKFSVEQATVFEINDDLLQELTTRQQKP